LAEDNGNHVHARKRSANGELRKKLSNNMGKKGDPPEKESKDERFKNSRCGRPFRDLGEERSVKKSINYGLKKD